MSHEQNHAKIEKYVYYLPGIYRARSNTFQRLLNAIFVIHGIIGFYRCMHKYEYLFQ